MADKAPDHNTVPSISDGQFSRLTEQVYPAVLGHIAYRMQGDDEKDDATQRTMELAYRYRSTYRGEAEEAAFRSWLFGIADRVIATIVRSRRAEPPVSLDEMRGHIPDPLADTARAVMDKESAIEDQSSLAGMLRDLPPSIRQVMALRYATGMKPGQIATEAGVTRGAVYTRLWRGRRMLTKPRRQQKLQESTSTIPPTLTTPEDAVNGPQTPSKPDAKDRSTNRPITAIGLNPRHDGFRWLIDSGAISQTEYDIFLAHHFDHANPRQIGRHFDCPGFMVRRALTRARRAIRLKTKLESQGM